MPIEKIFEDLNLEEFEAVEIDYSPFFARNNSEYAFVVKWTNRTVCNLNYLGGNRPPSTAWPNLVPTPISDDDGEIAVQIGHFPAGTNIKLSWGIQAADEIPRMVLLIANLTNKTVLQIAPNRDYKKMARGEFWQEKSEITLP